MCWNILHVGRVPQIRRDFVKQSKRLLREPSSVGLITPNGRQSRRAATLIHQRAQLTLVSLPSTHDALAETVLQLASGILNCIIIRAEYAPALFELTSEEEEAKIKVL